MKFVQTSKKQSMVLVLLPVPKAITAIQKRSIAFLLLFKYALFSLNQR